MEGIKLPSKIENKPKEKRISSVEKELQEKLRQLMQAKPESTIEDHSVIIPETLNPYPTDKLNALALQLKELSAEHNNQN